MTMIHPERMTAAVEEDFVVFLIGMRINKFWKVYKWLPVARSMLRMLDELYEHPELGLLGHGAVDWQDDCYDAILEII